jgi:hypothetical protein
VPEGLITRRVQQTQYFGSDEVHFASADDPMKRARYARRYHLSDRGIVDRMIEQRLDYAEHPIGGILAASPPLFISIRAH